MKSDSEILRLLLANDKLDINFLNILIMFYLWYWKSNISIVFKFKWLNEIWLWFYKTALYLAIENGNIDHVKLLLTNNKLDINILNIFTIFF